MLQTRTINLQQNQTQGGRPTASTGWVEEGGGVENSDRTQHNMDSMFKKK